MNSLMSSLLFGSILVNAIYLQQPQASGDLQKRMLDAWQYGFEHETPIERAAYFSGLLEGLTEIRPPEWWRRASEGKFPKKEQPEEPQNTCENETSIFVFSEGEFSRRSKSNERSPNVWRKKLEVRPGMSGTGLSGPQWQKLMVSKTAVILFAVDSPHYCYLVILDIDTGKLLGHLVLSPTDPKNQLPQGYGTKK